MSSGTSFARRRATDRLLDPFLNVFFERGRVEDIELITPRMRLIRVGGPGVSGLRWFPGQQVRVYVGDFALRTYSVWWYDDEWLELCVLDHGDGPGARWARSLKRGDEIAFRKPEGGLVADNSAAYHVFAGEETASVAFGAILRGLPDKAQVYGVVEVSGQEDELPLARSTELTWRHRNGASAASSASLVEAVRQLDLPDEPGVAYLAGEARTCQAVRDQLVRERGWSRRSVVVKPFWAPGKRGME